MTVDEFFETFLFTKAILILMKPILAQKMLIREQKQSIIIRRDNQNKQFANNFMANNHYLGFNGFGKEEEEDDEFLDKFDELKSRLKGKM